MKYDIAWRRQGNVHWEGWWTEENGPARTRIPDLDDHIGFVNYDLEHHPDHLGHPRVVRAGTGDLQLEVRDDAPHGTLDVVEGILNDHGFEFKRY